MYGKTLMKMFTAAALGVGSVGALSVPSVVSAQQVTVVVAAPPPAIVEVVPARPGPRFAWVAGYHRWQHDRYVWTKGYWALPPRGMHVWVPGHWDKARGGWMHVEGYWRR